MVNIINDRLSPITSKCEICNKIFVCKIKSRIPKTCSKECKNKLASQITIKQFSDPKNRENHRRISLEQKYDKEYQRKAKEGTKRRDDEWKANNYQPRKGKKHSIETKQKISDANAGLFKGKTWIEMYGKEMADRRRKENSASMTLTTERLLHNKKSIRENLLFEYLAPLGFEQNKQISRFNVDFINHQTNTIIEFYGDFWHMNPTLYNSDYVNEITKITASNKWKMDSYRKQKLESLGYKVIVLWENDLFKSNELQTSAVKKVINDLMA